MSPIKRLLDIVLSVVGLLVVLPILLPLMAIVWLQDYYSPLFVSTRVGRYGRPFRLYKLRSMVKGAQSMGGASTSATDSRITPVGHFIRRSKFDEVPQLWNVLIGDMSLVGPRPNVPEGVAVYTDAEKDLLRMRPGITDFASIVFADEGEVLRGSKDPDGDYDRLIRPWKSRLGLLYIQKANWILDLKLIALTLLAIVSRRRALEILSGVVRQAGADDALVAITRRESPLYSVAPPE